MWMAWAINECRRNAMRPLFPMAMILTLLAACADYEEEKADLPLTCQLSKCICAGPDKVFVAEDEPEPVLWRENGDAYCPDGFELKLVGK